MSSTGRIKKVTIGKKKWQSAWFLLAFFFEQYFYLLEKCSFFSFMLQFFGWEYFFSSEVLNSSFRKGNRIVVFFPAFRVQNWKSTLWVTFFSRNTRTRKHTHTLDRFWAEILKMQDCNIFFLFRSMSEFTNFVPIPPHFSASWRRLSFDFSWLQLRRLWVSSGHILPVRSIRQVLCWDVRFSHFLQSVLTHVSTETSVWAQQINEFAAIQCYPMCSTYCGEYLGWSREKSQRRDC